MGPFYTSQNLLAGSRSVTAINVQNQSTISCEVGVQFQKAYGVTNTCSVTLTIPAKQSRVFCSRVVNDPLMPCNASCSPALTYDTGHFFVSSTAPLPGATDKCKSLLIDARLFYTRDIADDLVEGATRLTVVKSPGEANLGD